MPKTVMIIDDEPDILAYLQAVLEDHGFVTCSAEASENIVAALKKHKPDLILLDVMMPRRSGLSIYRDLRRTPGLEHVPVALISGMEMESAFSDSELQALPGDPDQPPPDGFIVKPIKVNDLIANVTRLLEEKGNKD
jgi:twitching motility two-component system response regulator PilH